VAQPIAISPCLFLLQIPAEHIGKLTANAQSHSQIVQSAEQDVWRCLAAQDLLGMVATLYTVCIYRSRPLEFDDGNDNCVKRSSLRRRSARNNEIFLTTIRRSLQLLLSTYSPHILLCLARISHLTPFRSVFDFTRPSRDVRHGASPDEA
jgi:hypothetical protein